MADGLRERKTMDKRTDEVQAAENETSNSHIDTRKSCRCNSYTCRVSLLLSVTASVAIIIGLPSSIEPVIMDLGDIKALSYGGNSHLRQAVRLFEGQVFGPEGFAIDGDGNIYTGLNDGRIIRFDNNNFTTVTYLVGTSRNDKCGKQNEYTQCGRALGLEISPHDPFLLYICDSYHGIITLDLRTGEKRTIVNTSLTYPNVPPMKLINDVAVLKNGSLFFTDSSYKFVRSQVLLEVFEGRPNGKILHYNPIEGSLSVVLPQVFFANGITLGQNEEYLLIAETSKARILKYHLVGSKAGEVEIFMNELPGLPDNITPSSSGGYWIGYATLRNPQTDAFGRWPMIRNIIVKLGLTRLMVWCIPSNGVIGEYYANGTAKRELYDMGGVNVPGVSEILDNGNVLYLGSYEASYIGMLDLNTIEN